jgi:acetyl esterase
MPLDPQVRAAIDTAVAMGIKPAYQLSIEEGRRALEARAALMNQTLEPVHEVAERVIPGPGGDLKLRIYRPDRAGPLPVLAYYHGGGWVRGSLDTHEPLCRALTNQVGCLVVSVDYRLAPEAKYPAAVDDCYAATCWVAEHARELGVDASRLAVGGDSAGGNLAAVISQLARDRGGPPIKFQLLLYPVTGYDFETESYRQNAEGYMLERQDMIWYWQQYLPNEAAAREPYAAPLLGDLRGLPPAHVTTAEYDPLRDEGMAYAEALRAAGVPTTSRCYEGLIHGFYGMAAVVDRARQARDETAEALRQGLGG